MYSKLKSLLLFSLLVVVFNNAAFAIETSAAYALVVDANTDDILFSKNADEKMIPSSMTKLMTVYVVFNHLRNGIIKLDDTFTISENAWRKGGSRMFIEPQSKVSVEDLLKGVIIQSGNDASVALAEGIAGSEENFARLMNERASDIGMKSSNFKNATGWPAEGHYVTAKDLAILVNRIIDDFPEYYHYFAEKEFTYNNITQSNRNTLLWDDVGIDGLKTGHTEDAGYGIAISGVEEGRRVTVVVNGLQSETERVAEARKLFNFGIRYFTNEKLFVAGEEIEIVPVKYGEKEKLSLVLKQDVFVSMPKIDKEDVVMDIEYAKQPLQAPISKDEELAVLRIAIPELPEKIYPLYAGENVSEIGLLKKKWRDVKEFF